MQAAYDGRPFVQLLQEQGLAGGVQQVLLHAVAMADAAQPAGTASSPGQDTAAAGAQPLAAAAEQQDGRPRPAADASGCSRASSVGTPASDQRQPESVFNARQALQALDLYTRSAGRCAPGGCLSLQARSLACQQLCLSATCP